MFRTLSMILAGLLCFAGSGRLQAQQARAPQVGWTIGQDGSLQRVVGLPATASLLPAASGEQALWLALHPAEARGLRYDSEQRSLSLVDLRTLESVVLTRVDRPLQSVWSPDGSWLALQDADQTWSTWKLSGTPERRQSNMALGSRVAIANDGATLHLFEDRLLLTHEGAQREIGSAVRSFAFLGSSSDYAFATDSTLQIQQRSCAEVAREISLVSAPDVITGLNGFVFATFAAAGSTSVMSAAPCAADLVSIGEIPGEVTGFRSIGQGGSLEIQTGVSEAPLWIVQVQGSRGAMFFVPRGTWEVR